MSRHQIICVVHAETQGHHGHTHISEVGTGSHAGGLTQRWALQQVLDALDRQDEFFTEGETSGKTAEVHAYDCSRCGGRHIRTKRDHVEDNNLDMLKHCPLRKDQDDRPPQPNRRHA